MAKNNEQHSLRLIEKLSVVCFLLSFEIMTTFWGKLPTACSPRIPEQHFFICQDLIVYLLSGTSFFLLFFPLLFLLDRNLRKPNGRLEKNSRMTLSMALGCGFSIGAFSLISGLLPPSGPIALLTVGFSFAFLLNLNLIKKIDKK